LKRGEIWWADLGAYRPQEQTGRRPVIVWQSDTLTRLLQSVLVVPLTTSLIDDAEPLRVRIPVSQRLRRPSDLLIDQLRAIDNRRLIGGPMTRLPRALVARVDEAIREVLGLPEP